MFNLKRLKALPLAWCGSLEREMPAHESPSSLDLDYFAKVATTNGVEVSVPTPHSYVNQFLQNKFIEDWTNSNTGLRVEPFFPQTQFRSPFQLLHTILNKPFVSELHRFKLKAAPNCRWGSVGDADHYAFACPLTKDFHLVSPSQNAKKAWFRSIVRNPSIHSKLKSCIKIASTIRDQIP
ncbi:RNase H domain-containing protein [Trichonephila clavipes]|nr:RNase H domain-containing protein [Trichonephila clavipes]